MNLPKYIVLNNVNLQWHATAVKNKQLETAHIGVFPSKEAAFSHLEAHYIGVPIIKGGRSVKPRLLRGKVIQPKR